MTDIEARLARLETRMREAEKLAELQQVQLDAINAMAVRADEIVHAHQPFVDQVRRLQNAHAPHQELADALLAIRQLSSTLEDLVRRDTR